MLISRPTSKQFGSEVSSVLQAKLAEAIQQRRRRWRHTSACSKPTGRSSACCWCCCYGNTPLLLNPAVRLTCVCVSSTVTSSAPESTQNVFRASPGH